MPGRDEGFGAPAMENIIVQELLTVLFLRGKDGKMEVQEKKLTVVLCQDLAQTKVR